MRPFPKSGGIYSDCASDAERVAWLWRVLEAAQGAALHLSERARNSPDRLIVAAAVEQRPRADAAPGCVCADIDPSDRPCLICAARAQSFDGIAADGNATGRYGCDTCGHVVAGPAGRSSIVCPRADCPGVCDTLEGLAIMPIGRGALAESERKRAREWHASNRPACPRCKGNGSVLVDGAEGLDTSPCPVCTGPSGRRW